MNEADPAADEHARAQRPLPQRQAPLRRPPLGLPASVGSAVNGMQGFVERGVDTAYTVIDAYMRRGQQAAQRQQPFDPPAAPGAAAGAGAWPQTATAAWGQTASSIAEPWMQLARAWADGLAALAPLASRIGAGINPAAMPAGATAAAGPRAKLTIEFLSPQMAQVEVALEPGADLAALHADWSRDGQPAAAPGSFAFHCVPGHVHLRLALAEAAAPGRHQAAVADGHGQVWGSVAVTIAPRAAPAAAPSAT